MSSVRTSPRNRSAQFLDVISAFARAVIVMHDNPDPDAIASGWGLYALIETRLGMPVQLVGGGAIVRAENRHMVDLLNPPLELVEKLDDINQDCALILVDCALGKSNHLLTREGLQPTAVIDHHTEENRHNGERRLDAVSFVDVRPDVAASASMVGQYLREQHVEPHDKLATAMLYALRTETRGYETHYSELDRDLVVWLTEFADPSLLAEIESAPLTRAYFGDLALALQGTYVHGDTAFCLLPRAEGAEIVGEMADLLIRCRGVVRVLSGAVVDDDLLISVRTQNKGDHAARLVRIVLDGFGSGGGHDHRAGGKVARIAQLPVEGSLRDLLLERWLAACDQVDVPGTPLISRREIVENL